MPEAARAIGKCVAEYKMPASGFVKLGAITVGCAAIGGGMIWFSLATDDPNIGGRVIFSILGLLFLLPVALGVYGFTKGRKNAVRIHENGVVVHKAGVDFEVLFDAVDTYSDGGFLVIRPGTTSRSRPA
jgi:hypothetical protein